LDRYARHTVLPWFGAEGQRRLKNKSVLIVGCGGTGSTCAAFMARAGIGKMTLVDPDVVSLTDLHRQILYDEADVEHLTGKVEAAGRVLRESNHEVGIETVQAELTPGNAERVAAGKDLIIDCSDNFRTRLLINDVCLKHSTDWVHGAATGAAGIVIPFPAGGDGCYRCVVDRVPVAGTGGRGQPGVFGPAAGAVGCFEAAEAMRMLIAPTSVESRIIFFDIISNTYETIRMHRKKGCKACEGGIFEALEGPGTEDEFDMESGTARINLPGPLDLARVRVRLERHAVVETGGGLRVTTPGAEALFLDEGTVIVRPVRSTDEARAFVESLLGG
jgi:molybdopterin/thiamine biosynthesis adenylyltransferase